MRILMIHNHYSNPGGEDESTRLEVALLRSVGHSVTLLEAHNEGLFGSPLSTLSAGVKSVWSVEWFRRVGAELRTHAYDILHVQNFFPQISPSVYFAAASCRVPVVQAVRNYRLVCPSANLFRDGHVCTLCVSRKVKIGAVVHGCYRSSRVASSSVATMLATHQLAGTWSGRVSMYSAVSNFTRSKLIEGGIPAERIFVKPNFVDHHPLPKSRSRRHFLFVGRLTAEKGIRMLVDAYSRRPRTYPLKIVGEGDLRGPDGDGVEWLGWQSRDQVTKLMEEAVCCVVPGTWPEPFGRVAIESFACGTPVVATESGGLADIVDHGFNGFHFPVGDADALADCLSLLERDGDLVETLGRGALVTHRTRYSPEVNLEHLVQLYDAARRN